MCNFVCHAKPTDPHTRSTIEPVHRFTLPTSIHACQTQTYTITRVHVGTRRRVCCDTGFLQHTRGQPTCNACARTYARRYERAYIRAYVRPYVPALPYTHTRAFGARHLTHEYAHLCLCTYVRFSRACVAKRLNRFELFEGPSDLHEFILVQRQQVLPETFNCFCFLLL